MAPFSVGVSFLNLKCLVRWRWEDQFVVSSSRMYLVQYLDLVKLFDDVFWFKHGVAVQEAFKRRRLKYSRSRTTFAYTPRAVFPNPFNLTSMCNLPQSTPARHRHLDRLRRRGLLLLFGCLPSRSGIGLRGLGGGVKCRRRGCCC
jgi:hypothetical protein